MWCPTAARIVFLARQIRRLAENALRMLHALLTARGSNVVVVVEGEGLLSHVQAHQLILPLHLPLQSLHLPPNHILHHPQSGFILHPHHRLLQSLHQRHISLQRHRLRLNTRRQFITIKHHLHRDLRPDNIILLPLPLLVRKYHPPHILHHRLHLSITFPQRLDNHLHLHHRLTTTPHLHLNT